MMRNALSSRPASGTAFVGLLLLGALAVTGLLAWQAVDAGRSHAEAARKTLGEQARFAAWEYAGNAREYLDRRLLYPGLEVVARAGGRRPGAPLELDVFRDVAADKRFRYDDAVTGVFRVELSTGAVAFGGNEAGEVRREAVEAWLAGSLRRHAREGRFAGWRPVMLAAPGLGGIFVYRLHPDDRSEARVAYGFRVGPGGLDEPLASAFERSPLLPEGLTGARDNDGVFQVRVHDGLGRPVWRSPVPYVSEWSASDTLGTRYAGLTARVTVNPEVAPELVIGGLPSSRLPLIAILLLLTAGLVAAAFYQLRRETELARLRADFVSGVSHELRTPLAQIRMFSETLLLRRVRTPEEERRSLEIIVNESRRLTHQVDNVLLYSRSERHGIRMAPEETELGRLVDEVAEAFQPLAQAAGCRVEVAVSTGCVARVDGALLRQALVNLLDNAVKYGPAGQTVRLGLEVGRTVIRLWVEDEGSGVPAERRREIFEAYYRLEEHRESSVAGSGIGLAVVRRVAQAHRGEALVEEGSRGGARFVIRLPADVMSGVGPLAGARARNGRREASPGTTRPGPAPAPSPVTMRGPVQ
jgi:signal transduction histidine kinase